MADARKRSSASRIRVPKPARRRREEGEGEETAKLYRSGAVYNILFDHVFRRGRKTAIQMLDLREGDRVLEVGVGTGLSLKYWPRGIRLTGIDVSEQMLGEAAVMAKKLGREDVTLLKMDAMNLTFPDESFDKVVATHVLSAIPDARRAFEEIKRVCAPGGLIAIANYFHSRASVVRAAEKRLTPFTRKLGFTMDLSMEMLTNDPELSLLSHKKVNAGWDVLKLVKRSALSAAR